MRTRRRCAAPQGPGAAVALALLAWLACSATIAAAQSGPTVRFAGALNSDGCPFCCNFSCQLTPTPTPEFDAQGRRIFRRGAGQFLFVAELGPGTSNRQPSTEGVYSNSVVLPITDASGRPGLQVQTQRNLGNGSLKVDCRSTPLGGARGFPGLDFGPGADVTTGLQDMACRFELANSSTLGCTRDRFGNFAFLGAGTTRQFCFQVGGIDEFGLGDTIVALQGRDVVGNLGPRVEIVVRVDPDATPPPPAATATPTATPTSTPTRTRTPAVANVAGAVRYYVGARPVPNATVRTTGAAGQSTASQLSGAYMLANMAPTTLTVEPRKLGDFGSPPAISTLDASYVLQHVAGVRAFDARQRLACDVTGNGTLSTLDASRILQRQVGLLTRFAVAEQCDSDWVFDPDPIAAGNQRRIAPAVATGTCQRGGIAYEPLSGDAMRQDFVAILFGDCTGNWAPTGAANLAVQRPVVRLRVPRHPQAGMLRVPLVIDAGAPYNALDLTVTYRGAGLRPLRVRKLRGAEGAMLVSNFNEPGRVRIALASATPLEPGGLLVLDFTAADDAAILVERAIVE